MFILIDIRVKRLYVHVLDRGTVRGLLVRKSLATAPVLTFPHDGVHVTTDTCTFDLSFRFAILVVVVVVYPLPLPLFLRGVRSSRFWSTSQLIPPSGQELHHSSVVCQQIQVRRAYMDAVEQIMCVVCVDVTEGNNGDRCIWASTLCKYNLRKRDLYVLSWAMVRRVRRGSLSSELLMCGGGVRSILIFSLVARCQGQWMYAYGACLFLCLL